MTSKRLTVPEKLLVAALEARKRSPTFTAEDLVVEAWKLFPDSFGLSGYADKFPDSNRVLTKIMGTQGMRGKGWLRKVGEKQYRLTSAAFADAEALLKGGSEVVSAGEGFLRAQLDRETSSALERLLSTAAAQKIIAGQADIVSFHEACGFWDITARSNANTLTLRLTVTSTTLDQALAAATSSADAEGLKLSSGQVVKSDLELLRDAHISMQKTFATELEIIGRRTDERSEKRSKQF